AFHPALANAGILYDGSAERRVTYSLEGGDVHPLRSDLVLLGYSSRSSAAALDHLCDVLFERTSVTE
ncbi:MAG: arginine deiminase, partial [Gemmatimonadales bacterium]|nr:arginine deiminase [Gemmatimonadales bacterium]